MSAAGGDAGSIDVARSDAARIAEEHRAARDWRGLADARRRQGDIARSAGDLEAAGEYMRAACSLYIMLNDGYWATQTLTLQAEIQLSIGDCRAAAELCAQAVERMPGDTRALTVLAYADWQAGSLADAEVIFTQVLHWDADHAEALAGRGQVRADMGTYSLALDDLDRVLKLPLDLEAESDARSARALALAGLGRVETAQSELAKSLRLLPGRPRTNARASRIAVLVGDGAEAKDVEA